MFNPIRLMKIFEWLWLTAATIALIMAIVRLANGAPSSNYGYLLMVFVLCTVMFFIKRKSRQWLEARQSSPNS